MFLLWFPLLSPYFLWGIFPLPTFCGEFSPSLLSVRNSSLPLPTYLPTSTFCGDLSLSLPSVGNSSLPLPTYFLKGIFLYFLWATSLYFLWEGFHCMWTLSRGRGWFLNPERDTTCPCIPYLWLNPSYCCLTFTQWVIVRISFSEYPHSMVCILCTTHVRICRVMSLLVIHWCGNMRCGVHIVQRHPLLPLVIPCHMDCIFCSLVKEHYCVVWSWSTSICICDFILWVYISCY